MNSSLPTSESQGSSFPLAVLAARIMACALVIVAVVGASAWAFTRGAQDSLGLLAGFIPEIVVLLVCSHFLRKGNQIVAGFFVLWCVWGFFNAIGGADDPFAAVLLYALGVLNFVGIVGVVKDFSKVSSP